MSFSSLVNEINNACQTCHLAPAGGSGNFTYVAKRESEEVIAGGQQKHFKGLVEAGASMSAALLDGRMPPESLRAANPKAYDELGSKIKAWIDAGYPEGSFSYTSAEGSAAADEVAGASSPDMTDLAECIPAAALIGTDRAKDEFFAAATELPEQLAQTDLFSLDAYELAKKGTVAYNVEYPLWADNAEKGRWMHVPAGQQITYDAATRKVTVPANTRFYKTFYKALKQADGETRFRKIETRIIVTRAAPAAPLFGTYLWDVAERKATLLKNPYRDGTPWKDHLMEYLADQASGAKRPYAVPARHRCLECHQGAEGQNCLRSSTSALTRPRC